jgi:hypothetical protein
MIAGMLATVAERSRPGIRFETASPPVPEALPRMDVAALIGFAERGPLHCPVAIEDMSQFEKVFGETARLGWAENGEQISGLLAQSVNSFFIQGGRRCWIVRVAGSSASSQQFVIPNLYRVTPLANSFVVMPAQAQARSEGSWSDQLRVASRLQMWPIVLESLKLNEANNTWQLRTRSNVVRIGDLLRIEKMAGTQQAFFPIIRVERDSLAGEFVLTAQTAVAFANANAEPVEMGNASAWLDGKTTLLNIDLRVRDEQTSEWRNENIGLTPLHPRYCGALPSDLEVYRGNTSGIESSQPAAPGARVDAAPWFPLATNIPGNGSATDSFMVPLGMSGGFDLETMASSNTSSALERDGLLNFEASMFLDSDLRDASIADLIDTANALRYTASVPRPLRGIHAVLGWFNTSVQDEVTMLAVPDAVHQPWQAMPQALRYAFSFEEILPKVKLANPDPFVCCNELTAPFKLTASGIHSSATATQSGSMVRLSWEMPPGVDNTTIVYQLQESASENFRVVDQVLQTPVREAAIVLSAPGRRIFRVRAMSAGQTSAWSPAIALKIVEIDKESQQNIVPGEVAREIQRELIKLCAAQGEMFAILSLPKKITEQEAANHVQSLAVLSRGGEAANSIFIDPEGRVGSYAAIYHPWVETRGSSGSVTPLPPDGTILGMLAARTIERGAWIAPANRVLKGVVALHTTLPDIRQARLIEAGINLVLDRPQGYTLLSEETLSSNGELSPIHVRRLLILMRRIMLRLGEEFTFETNSQALRALVRQRCYSMLERMFKAGAFSGRSAADAFQVTVDDVDNPQASIDAGRLIIRVRIRPAQALRFITIRFTLGGGGGGVAEESTA